MWGNWVLKIQMNGSALGLTMLENWNIADMANGCCVWNFRCGSGDSYFLSEDGRCAVKWFQKRERRKRCHSLEEQMNPIEPSAKEIVPPILWVNFDFTSVVLILTLLSLVFMYNRPVNVCRSNSRLFWKSYIATGSAGSDEMGLH